MIRVDPGPCHRVPSSSITPLPCHDALDVTMQSGTTVAARTPLLVMSALCMSWTRRWHPQSWWSARLMTAVRVPNALHALS